MAKIKPITFDEWMDEVNKPFVKPPNSFFLNDFMEKTKLPRTTARYRLEKMVSEGKLKSESILHEGKYCVLFTIV